jgi:hypothetical protein
MSSTPISSPIKNTTPNAPVKAAQEKVVQEKVVKVVKEKKEKVVKEKVVKEKKEKVVKEKVVKEKVVKEKKEKVTGEVTDEVAEVKEKKARAPTLLAKQAKFIQYSYYLIRAINNAALEKSGAVLIDEDVFIEAAHIFDTVETQTTFVNTYLENKGIAKEMRTHLADKKKAVITAEKAAAKAIIDAEKAAVKLAKAEAKMAAKAATKAKQPKKTAKKTANQESVEEPDLVTSLVTLANSNEPAAEPIVATDTTAAVPEEEEEEELDVRMFTIEGTEYLIDDNSNLYDTKSHVVIGVWNKDTNTIVHA